MFNRFFKAGRWQDNLGIPDVPSLNDLSAEAFRGSGEGV